MNQKLRWLYSLVTIFLLSAGFSAFGQVTIVGFDFSNEDKKAAITDGSFTDNPYTADAGIDGNVNQSALMLNGPSFLGWVAGVGGNDAANSTGWDAPSGNWSVTFTTEGYENLTVSSIQRGSNTGPRDFVLEYKVGADGDWTPVSNSEITVANNTTTGVLNDLELPAELNDQAEVSLRWLNTSTTSINGNVTGSAGTNRLATINVTGDEISSGTPTYTLTLQVDMGDTPVSEGVVTLGAAFTNPSWSPDEFELSQVDGTSVWEIVLNESQLSLEPGAVSEFKFVNGPGWGSPDENFIGQPCNSGGNRAFTIPEESETVCFLYNTCLNCDDEPTFVDVTFTVDMSNEDVNAEGVFIAGSRAPLNFGTNTPLSDNGDGTWSVTLAFTPGDLEYKFKNGPDGWEDNPAQDCNVNNNRGITIPDDVAELNLDVVCFNSCEACPGPEPLTAFDLLTPPNEATLPVEGDPEAPVAITWEASSEGATYTWLAITEGGDFDAPFLGLASDGEGIATTLTLTVGAIDAILEENSVAVGESITLSWTVRASNGEDNLDAANGPFEITLTRGVVDFPNMVDVTFQVAFPEDVTPSEEGVFVWLFGYMDTPMAMTASEDGVYSAVVEVVEGDDYIYKFLNGPEGFETQTEEACFVNDGEGNFNRTLVGPEEDTILDVVCFNSCEACPGPEPLTAFDLLTPPNEASVPVEGDPEAPVAITWEASSEGATYTWLAITEGGDFDAPFLGLASDEEGSATTLTLTVGAIDAILEENSVAVGESITLSWTVRASNGEDNLDAANGPFEITLTRGVVDFPNMVDVTFQVAFPEDVTPSEEGVFVWLFGYMDTPMAMTASEDGVYSAVVEVVEGDDYIYKFLNGPEGFETQTEEACFVNDGEGNFNRTLVGPEEATILDVVCFNSCEACPEPPALVPVNFTVGILTQSLSENGMNIAGSWNNFELQAMSIVENMPEDENGGGSDFTFFEINIDLEEGVAYQYKFVNGTTFEEISEGDCIADDGQGNFNRTLTVDADEPVVALVEFGSCDAPDTPTDICNDPEDVTASSITTDSATISWTPGVDEDTFEMLYGEEGFLADPENDGILIENIQATSQVIAGLMPSTSYDAYLRAVCEDEVNSEWVLVQFTTEDVPVCEGLESFSADFNVGTLASSGVTSNYFRATTGQLGVNNTPALRTNQFNPVTAERFIQTPVVENIQAGDELSFYYRWVLFFGGAAFEPQPGDSIVFSIIPDCGEGTPVQVLKIDHTNHVASDEMAQIIIELNDFVGEDVAARINSYRATGDWFLIFDNIALGGPACWNVYNVSATDLTNESAVIEWVNDLPTAGFEVLYGLEDFNPEDDGTLVSTAENSIEITGLDETTTYDAYVRSSCSEVLKSEWTKVTFTTLVGVDIAATALVSPVAADCFGTEEEVQVSVTNAGGLEIDFSDNNLTITVEVTGAATATLTSVISEGTLDIGESATFSVGSVDMSSVGSYTFEVSVSLVGDANDENDELAAVTLSNSPVDEQFPYEEDFNDYTLFADVTGAGFVNFMGGLWTLSPADWGFESSRAIRANVFGTTATSQVKAIATPSIEGMPAAAVLTFKHKFTAWAAGGNNPYEMNEGDKLEVFVLDLCSGSEDLVYTITPETHTTSNEWNDNVVSLFGYNDSEVRIIFKATRGVAGDWWAGVDNIELRDSNVETFNLLTPANGAELVVEGDFEAEVNITWESADEGANYTWLAVLPGGNFADPFLAVPSNSGGSANTLTLTIQTLDNILASNGLMVGDDIDLEWTVVADVDGELGFAANGPFEINLERGDVIYGSLITTVPPSGNATSAVGRGPASQNVFQRSSAIYLAEEMEAIPAGTNINSIGYTLMNSANDDGAPDNPVSGTIKYYMINTTDEEFERSTTWTELIDGMELVYEGPLTIPNQLGTYTINLDTPFEYLGEGMYIAFEWEVTSATSTPAAIYQCNNTIAGSQRNTALNNEAHQDVLGNTSNFRPRLVVGYDGFDNDLSVDAVYALGEADFEASETQIVQVFVSNIGGSPVSNVDVTVELSGANTGTFTETIPFIAVGESVIAFVEVNASELGETTFTASVPEDDVLENNQGTWVGIVGEGVIANANSAPRAGNLTVNNAQGAVIAIKANIQGAKVIPGIDLFMGNSASAIGRPVKAGLFDINGTLLAESAPFIVTAESQNAYRYFGFAEPILVEDEEVFAGIIIDSNTSGNHFPIGFQTESPGRFEGYFTKVGQGSGTFNMAAGERRMMIKVRVAPEDACPEVENVTAVGTGQTTADVSWDATAEALTYRVEYGEVGFTLGQGTVIDGVEGTSLTLEGLMSSTEYEVYVQADCEGVLLSSAVSATFQTDCGIFELPFFEGFEGNTFPPACWNSINVLGTNQWVRSTAAFFSGIASAQINWQNPIGEDWLVTPQLAIPAEGDYQLSFAVRRSFAQGTYEPDSLKILISTTGNDVADFDVSAPIFELDVANGLIGGEWSVFTVSVNDFLAENIYIAFRHTNNDGHGIYLDDVSVAEVPPCAAPENSAVASVTASEAVLTWDAVDGAEAYEVLYGIEGFLADPEDAGTLVSDIESNTVTLSDLAESTNYDAYLRTICEDGVESDWVLVSFSTSCAAFDVPFSEGFETTDILIVPDCWSRETNVNAWSVASSPTIGAFEGEKFAATFFNATSAKNDWLFTPGLNLEADENYSLRFYLKAPGWDGDAESLAVYLQDAASSEGALIEELFVTEDVLYPDYVEINVSFSVADAGVYFVAFHAFSPANIDYIAIDEVSVVACNLNAGEDNVATVCDGDLEYDLNTLLSDDADEDGEWFDADGIEVVDGLISPLALGSGEFEFTYVVSNDDCSDAAVMTLTLEPCVGIALINGNTDYTLFPNPSTGLFNIVTEFTGNVLVEIADLQGRTVYAKQHAFTSNATEQVDISGVSQGIYIIRMTSGNEVSTGRIVVK
jgi:hypothetical protein